MPPIALAYPGLLTFLAALPVLWWLLRLTPPSPQKRIFPAIMLLRDLVQPDQTPRRSPWWLLILRLLLCALLILALAHPTLNPPVSPTHNHDLLIVIDNDWAAARDWEQRQQRVADLVADAAVAHRPVMLLTTAPTAANEPPTLHGPMVAELATTEVKNIRPEAWAADWRQAIKALPSQHNHGAWDIVWIASGVGGQGANDFYEALQKSGSVRVTSGTSPIYVVQPPSFNNDGNTKPTLTVLRTDTEDDATATITAEGSDGAILARLPAHFAVGAPHADAVLDLPLSLHHNITRFAIEGRATAATTVLADSNFATPGIGLVGDETRMQQHSLLDDATYIDRALKPAASLHVASLTDLLKENPASIILTDNDPINDLDRPQLANWVKQGGVLIRFAGEHLAASMNPDDAALLPVTLRTGDRALGGALSWATPQNLQPFPVTSPFYGLAIPPDVTVSRQILAEPETNLTKKSWAALADGTSLVTAKPIGRGLSILFHISAQADWSNLPLSGLFVDMLHRCTELSQGVPASGAAFTDLPPLSMLDGFGVEEKPAALVESLPAAGMATMQASPQHPPGLYGTASYHLAFNLGTSIGQPVALRDITIDNALHANHTTDLQPFLLAAVFAVFVLDLLLSLWLRGLVMLPRQKLRMNIVVLGLLVLPVAAQASALKSSSPVDVTAQTMLAYVATGDRDTDATSEAGLNSLAQVLENRTSLDHVAVIAVNPDQDDLAFYPLIYWPLIPGGARLTPAGVTHVNAYLHHGGMIMFDTMTDDDPSPQLVKQQLAGVGLPVLRMVPDHHVLKRSFYLLDDFPGRYTGHAFWLEPEDMSSYDNVATVLLGSHAWAAAWARDNHGHFQFPCIPGGELQREYAFRFGVNLVMYALTGNYKSDQLHVQALLDKVGK